MALTPSQGIGALLVAVTAVVLLLTLRRLRGVPARSLRSKLLGGLVPVAATAAFVALGWPPYSLTVVGIAAAVGLVLGLLLGRGGGRPMDLESHQRGLAVLLWSLVLILTGLASLSEYGGLQAVTTVALVATAGFAAGVQLGILARPRFRGTKTGLGAGSGAAASSAAPLALLAVAALTFGPWVGIAAGQGEGPDPCTFMDVTIWPGPVVDPPGVLRGSDADRPSCTAGFKYDTDDAGFALVGTITVIQLPTEAEARAAVTGAGAVLGQTSVELGDGGVEGLYLDGAEQGYAAYFSVHNYIGWVKGHADSDKRIQQARAAAGRLAELMQAAIAGPVEPSPTPEPTLAPTPTPTPTIAPTPSAPAPSLGSETAAPATPAPTAEPTTPSGAAFDLGAVLAQFENVGQSLTMRIDPLEPQVADISIQGIGAALAVLVIGLFLARFGGPKPAPVTPPGGSGGTGGGPSSGAPITPKDPEPGAEPVLARWPEDAEPIS